MSEALGPWPSVAAVMAALNESGRPKAPTLPEATEFDRRRGQGLAEIHRMYLTELAMTRRLLTQVERQEADPAVLREAVGEMEVAKNLRAFGSLCGRNCQIVNAHHNIEEFDTFVRVEAGGHPEINAVVAKLREEHKVIHALLEQLYGAAVNLVEEPSQSHFQDAARIFDQFEAVLKSHFGYEEVELEEALGLFNAL